MEIPKNYNPHEIEPKWNSFWIENKFSTPSEKGTGKPVFVIVIPPPNITDVLHLGHALNNLIQDVLVRRKRMLGFDTLWLPGTDHAGIATQNMVEKEFLKKGKTRHEVGREKFLEALWQWKDEKGGTIIRQLMEIGCSCDWTRTRFTLDEGFSRAVREVFVKLYEEGLIYRGKYIINWCPRCETALADDEVEYEEHKGSLWYIKYPFVDDPSDGIIVATTRPETMLGDTAVAVHPDDTRYKNYVGKKLRLPLVKEWRDGETYSGEPVKVSAEIPVITDSRVSVEFGTGAVKVTPAHDPNDYWIGKDHNLPVVLVMDVKARMNLNAGEYESLDRYNAREQIVERLKETGLLVKVEPHTHSIGHCYRCHTVIEPYLSTQWFVRMKPLAEPAIEVVKNGEVSFFPERWKGVYFNWMENIRDWCISRQLWWGHRIPVCYGPDGQIFVANSENEAQRRAYNYYGKQVELTQDEDVLDTWFSSWLWPFGTMGWPDMTDDLERFYPTDVLVTASEIIFFWVARMIMAGIHFCGKRPFHTVYIHGTVRDTLGRKMSKSLGNGIDPLDVVKVYGRDALRFTLISQAAAGQDLFIDMKSFEIGRNFANKVWNASRLLFLNIGEEKFNVNELQLLQPQSLLDRWMLSRLAIGVEMINDRFENYRLDEAVFGIHKLFWKEFCDWFLEGAKLRFKNNDKAEKLLAISAFEVILRVMHPILPYLTEELWHKLGDVVDGLVGENTPSIMLAQYPKADDFKKWRDEKAETDFEKIQELITQVRNITGTLVVGSKIVGKIYIVCQDRESENLIVEQSELIKFLARVEDISIVQSPPSGVCGSAVTKLGKIYLPLEGLVDIDKERQRLEKEIKKLELVLDSIRKKIGSSDFLMKAPPNVVEAEKEKEREYSQRLKVLKEQYNGLLG